MIILINNKNYEVYVYCTIHNQTPQYKSQHEEKMGPNNKSPRIQGFRWLPYIQGFKEATLDLEFKKWCSTLNPK